MIENQILLSEIKNTVALRKAKIVYKCNRVKYSFYSFTDEIKIKYSSWSAQMKEKSKTLTEQTRGCEFLSKCTNDRKSNTDETINPPTGLHRWEKIKILSQSAQKRNQICTGEKKNQILLSICSERKKSNTPNQSALMREIQVFLSIYTDERKSTSLTSHMKLNWVFLSICTDERT